MRLIFSKIWLKAWQKRPTCKENNSQPRKNNSHSKINRLSHLIRWSWSVIKSYRWRMVEFLDLSESFRFSGRSQRSVQKKSNSIRTLQFRVNKKIKFANKLWKNQKNLKIWRWWRFQRNIKSEIRKRRKFRKAKIAIQMST